MNWLQFLPMLLVLGVAVFFVWRSAGQKKHEHTNDCGCGCGQDHSAKPPEKNSPPT